MALLVNPTKRVIGEWAGRGDSWKQMDLPSRDWDRGPASNVLVPDRSRVSTDNTTLPKCSSTDQDTTDLMDTLAQQQIMQESVDEQMINDSLFDPASFFDLNNP